MNPTTPSIEATATPRTVTRPDPAVAPKTETFVIDPDHSEIGFSVRHLVSRTRGRFERFSGEVRLDRQRLDHSSVTFEVDASSIDTRQPDRDAHLRSADFFDVEHYPTVRFTSERITPIASDRYRVEGTLELRGIRKPTALEVSFLGVARDPWGNERAGFSTQAVVNRKEFGMVWNTTLDNGGLILGDEVHLTIDLETIRKG